MLKLLGKCVLIFALNISGSNGFFRECKEKSDIVFLIDTSGSVEPTNFLKVKSFIKRILLPANIDGGDVRVGILLYDTSVKVEFHLNTYTTKRELFDHIDATRLRGRLTNTADALRVMNEEMFRKTNGDRKNVQNIAIVITDGMSSVKENETIPRAKQARLNGIHIFAIGIGDVFDKEIRGIASMPSMENAFILEGFAQLRRFKDDFFKFCTVVDPRTSCYYESAPGVTNKTIYVCTVFNVWDIQCKDVAWTNDEMKMRIGDDYSTKINCTVNDKMTLTTSMIVHAESNWTAIYSPIKEIQIGAKNLFFRSYD